MARTNSLPPLSLNGSWEFRFEEGKSLEEVANPAFEATDTMVVPACYDTFPKWFLKRGTGLYRRTFTLAQPVENAWLVVDGMGLRGDFRIDGHTTLGVHPYPYARLELETGPLDAGTHMLFAALDNRLDWKTVKLVRPYYDFYLYGGFYRGISLVFDHRKLFVRTRDYKSGLIELEAVDFPAGEFTADLCFDEAHSVKVGFRSSRATVCVPQFKLWSPEHPNLHRVTLKAEGMAPLSVRFGIREIKAEGRRILLNGEPIYLKGVNRHDSHIEFGVATPESQMLRDLQLIKSLNANFIRGAHYQQSQRFLDLCDEMGILVWEESLGWGNGQPYTQRDGVNELLDPDFVQQQLFQTREMVRTSFNHPSVIIFGSLNECDGRQPECKTLVDALVDVIRAEDSGRLVTFACNVWNGDLCNERTDLVAFNAYPGVIPLKPGLPEELAANVRDGAGGFNTITRYFREKYPDKPIIVSESGVGGQYGCHDEAAACLTEEFQNEFLNDVLETIFTNPDLTGYAIWQFADNRTYHRNSSSEPGKPYGISIAGLYNSQRQPKLSVQTVRKWFGTR
ncbi:MAG: family 1 glycosylhydrolase [Victivallales bacterium]|nr:family 1 glycosylhydrolase [Victivallales bacterium]